MRATSTLMNQLAAKLVAQLLIGLALAASYVAPAAAQGLPLIRDTEIEALLNDYSQNIFKAAGFGGGRVAVRIVNNEAFNAFVVDGRSVYMHTGALMQAETPNEVIGVLAHESGHIAGGHMAALRARIAKDQTRALLVQILGIGAMIGGAVAGGDAGQEIGSAGQGVMMGGNELIMRGLLGRAPLAGVGGRPGRPQVTSTRRSSRAAACWRPSSASPARSFSRTPRRIAFARTHPVATDRLARLRQLVGVEPISSMSRTRPSCSSATT